VKCVLFTNAFAALAGGTFYLQTQLPHLREVRFFVEGTLWVYFTPN
jgi:hypothetical protein